MRYYFGAHVLCICDEFATVVVRICDASLMDVVRMLHDCLMLCLCVCLLCRFDERWMDFG